MSATALEGSHLAKQLRPQLADSFDGIGLSVFEEVDARLRAGGRDDVLALHQGKTTYGPAVTLDAERMVRGSDEFDLVPHTHAPPAGSRRLRQLIADHVSARRRLPVDTGQVLVTNGATHGIGIVLRAVTRPGEEVIVLSPHWPFSTGLVRAALARPVQIPVFLQLVEDPTFDLVGQIERHVGPSTRAIYFNSPNNPTGFSLTDDHLRALVELAERRGLWLVVDNAYENFDFTREGFRDAAAVGSGEHVFAVHTFSKTYAMPGFRIGYVVSPPGVGPTLEKLALHSVYAVSSSSQWAAARALASSQSELDRRRQRAAAAWDAIDRSLEVPHTAVQGGLYTFLDLRHLDDPSAFLDRCLDRGVSLAPGRAFGDDFDAWARLCFTAVAERELPDAANRINDAYRGSR